MIFSCRLSKNKQTNLTLLLWHLRSTCFPLFFGRYWRHQKDISKLSGLYRVHCTLKKQPESILKSLYSYNHPHIKRAVLTRLYLTCLSPFISSCPYWASLQSLQGQWNQWAPLPHQILAESEAKPVCNHVKLGVSLRYCTVWWILAMGLAELWGIADLHCTAFRKAYILSGSGFHEFLESF